MTQTSMLAGFALYQDTRVAKPPTVSEQPEQSQYSTTPANWQPTTQWQQSRDRTISQRLDVYTIATPIGCRLMRIIRLPRGWRLWNATRDFVFGSYLELFDDGRVMNMTTRQDEGDDYYWVRPADDGRV